MTRPTTSLVWLFDIDGTLLLTKGAGREAISLALRDQFGVDDDLRDVPFQGRTDTLILGDILERHGLRFVDGERARFWDRVTAHMRALMDPPRGGLLPGVPELLAAVGAEPGWACALLTGNVSTMARVKLESFGAWRHFAWGTFGEEGPDRDALARLAVARAAERHGVPPGRCVVVGDTRHDIACARAAGARVVAVASGGAPREELAALAPDLLLDDLREHALLREWGRGLAQTARGRSN
jgi:phosphoglycolate phosphatase